MASLFPKDNPNPYYSAPEEQVLDVTTNVSSQPEQPKASTSLFKNFANLYQKPWEPIIGAGKTVISRAHGAAKLGGSIGSMLEAMARGRTMQEWQQEQEAKKPNVLESATVTPEALAPKGFGENVGAGAETVAEFFVPGLQGEAFAGKFPKLQKALQPAIDTILTGSRQQGELTKETIIMGALNSIMAPFGKIPQYAMGAAQTGTGAVKIATADTPEEQAQGLVDVGAGFTGIRQASQAKGIFKNEAPAPDAVREKNIETMRRVLNLGAGVQKKVMRNQSRTQDLATPEETAVDHGVVIHGTGDNKIDAPPTLTDIKSKVSSWHNATDEMLQANPQKRHGVEDLKTKIYSSIDSQNVAPHIREEQKKDVDTLLNGVEKEFGDRLNDAELNRVKQWFQDASAFDMSKSNSSRDANRLASYVTRKTIEDANPDLPIREFNKVQQELLQLADAVQSKHGQVVRGGYLGKKVNQAVGAVVGSQIGGPAGSIAGAVTADKLTDFMLDPYMQTMGAKKKLDLSGYIPEWKSLDRAGREAAWKAKYGPKTTPALEGGKTMYAGPATTKTPESGVASQTDAVARLRELGYTGPLTKEELKGESIQTAQKRLAEWLKNFDKNPPKYD